MDENQTHILQAYDIAKTFKRRGGRDINALRDVTLHVWEGEIYGLVGPNGAGKSTLFSILLGFAKADSGRIVFMGHDGLNSQIRGKIGYIPEDFRCYRFWTVRGALMFFATLQGIPYRIREYRVDQQLDSFDLRKHEDIRVSQCSKGMLQRLGLAQALLGEPKLLILDEPVASLDPIGRAQMREYLLTAKAAGVSILISSHLMDDMEQICDRIGILHEGKLVAEGTLDEVLNPRGSYDIRFSLPSEESWTALGNYPFHLTYRKGMSGRAKAPTLETKKAFEQAITKLNGRIDSVSSQQESLEQALLRYVKESIDGSDLGPDPVLGF